MNTKCPVCGAPLTGMKCDYCGYEGAAQQVAGSYPQMQSAPPQQIVINNVAQNQAVANANNGIPMMLYSQKSKMTALLLCIFLGGFGIHRFYVGKIVSGIIWLLSFGLFGIGWLVDIVLILIGSFKDSRGLPLR